MWVRQYFNNNGPVDLTALDEALLKPMRELLGRGGKRWRPYLLVLCAQATQHCGVGPSSSAVSDSGSGVLARAYALSPVPELLHNATLIIDDIEDRSPLRRDAPAIHKVFGEDIAINAANFFYFYPILYAQQLCTAGSDLAVQVEAMIIEEMANVHLGQALDIFWHNNPDYPVTEAQYSKMCRLKTGTMARLAARLGVLAGVASTGTAGTAGSDLAVAARSEPALARFAETLGVAFQIRDDLENISPEGRAGKTWGDDITEGKRSLLVIKALKQLGNKDAAELKAILKSHPHDRAQIARAIALIGQTDALDYTRQTIQSFRQKALDLLAQAKLRDVSKLEDLASQIA